MPLNLAQKTFATLTILFVFAQDVPVAGAEISGEFQPKSGMGEIEKWRAERLD